MTAHSGEIAALLTAVCYSASSIFFTLSGRKFGSLLTNRLRLIIAILLLGATHWIVYGTPFPAFAEPWRWFWLASSGIIGLAIGDLFLFQTYVTLGPRMGLLFLSFSPAIAALMAWLFLHESLRPGSILGIILTIAGVSWVVLESNRNGGDPSDRPSFRQKIFIKGIGAGLAAATGQAVGMVFSKIGLANNYPPLSGNVIRFAAAFLALWGVTVVQGQLITTARQASYQRLGLLLVLGGAIFGPLFGVSLSLYAIQHTDIGVASTIISIPPIFLLPIGYFFFKENISWQAVAGTILAIAGVVVLFWL